MKLKKITVLLFSAILLIGFTYSSADNYEAMWKKVNEMEQKGLVRSALAEVEKIYQKAKSEENHPNWVQAYIYKSKYQSQIEEEGEAKVLLRFEEDIPNMPEPSKSILHHYAGQYFRQYMQNNQYRFSQRTEFLVEDDTDVRTWSSDRLERRSRYHLLSSLKNKSTVQTPASNFKNLFTNEFKVKWDVSLYDQLLYQAIRIFENNTNSHKPVNRFELDSSFAFLPVSEFVDTPLSSADTTDYNFLTWSLYQQWLGAHLESGSKAQALINAKRLSFAHILTGDSDQYLTALDKAQKSNASTACIYDYYLALHYISIGARYSVTRDDTDRIALKKAHQIASSCENCSWLDKACQDLVDRLQEPSMSMSIENVNQIDKTIPAQIIFKNYKKLYYHIYKLNNKNNWFDNFYDNQGNIKLPRDATHVGTEVVHLMDELDYQSHSVNVELDAMAPGQYVLVLTEGEHIPKRTSGRRTETIKFQVSNLAVVNRSIPGAQEFYVTNREVGSPIENIGVDFYNYNHRQNKGLSNLIKSITTDKNGRCVDALSDKGDQRAHYRRNRVLIIKNGDDHLLYDRNYHINTYMGRNRDHKWTQVFTDRAIYRPGQTIYYKGVNLNRDSEQMNTIVPNAKLDVMLRDANNREVGKASHVTNEFGSFKGEFVIPVGTINGRFTIRVGSSGYHQVQVEEYKRPTFEAVFDTLRGDYVMGEEISVSGLAKNLTGNVLQNATGSYRVVRSTYFPYGFSADYFRICFPHFQTNEEIANGPLELNDDGTFNIAFNSSQDQQFEKLYKPVHNYLITITVIDETGESHDFSQNMTVGPTAVQVNIKHDPKIDFSESPEINLVCTNYNNQPKDIKGTYTIRQLGHPSGYISTSQWPSPDIRLEDTSKPGSAWSYYHDPSDYTAWKTVHTVVHSQVEIVNDHVVDLSSLNMPPGKYMVQFDGQDAFGNLVNAKTYFDLFDGEKGQMPTYQHHFIKWDDKNYEPGDLVKIDLYSADEVWVLISEDRKSFDNETGWVKIKGHKQLSYTVREKDRGNFYIQTVLVYKNRYVQKNIQVKVPWTNKDLKIEYISFRDKLIPGQKEKWVIKLSGHKKDQVAAELMAALYDASLDAFVDHKWAANFYPMHNLRTHWSAYGFGARRGHHNNIGHQGGRDFLRFPHWNMFGLMNFYGRNQVMMRGAFAENEIQMDAASAPVEEFIAVKAGDVNTLSADDDAVTKSEEKETINPPLVRTNLQETVFFYPDLRTDAEGNILIEFTMGEALTKWKLLTFAHTKELEYGFDTKELVTQKDFMVFPLFPRFFREFDQITIKSKVVNLTDKSQDINVNLILQDGISKVDKTDLFHLSDNTRSIALAPNESKTVSWNIEIPSIVDISSITAQVIAQSGDKSDGEEHLIPVLTNRKLVTEALSMPLKSLETRSWTLTDLKELLKSTTAEVQNVSLEVSSNPAWYAILALPYLSEKSHESTSSKMSRFYANQLATYIINKNPNIKNVFNQWKVEEGKGDYNAFMSHLEKNQELKYVILEQTPWVAAAQSEEEQRRRIALFFDLNKLSQDQSRTWNQISNAQNSDGGFSWMPGGRSNWTTTLHVLSSLAHLQELNAMSPNQLSNCRTLINRALSYSDHKLKEYYMRLQQSSNWGGRKMKEDHLNRSVIYHLYIRSQFNETPLDGDHGAIHAYFLDQAEKFWMNRSIYSQGLLALALHRYDRTGQVSTIVQSLKERSLEHEELGRYWKYDRGYYWYQRPIETQALMIEVFNELSDDREMVEALKIWLLKHKQTNHWKTSRATSEAVFALLSTGPSLLEMNEAVQVKLSHAEFIPDHIQTGTGYFKESWNAESIHPDLAEIELINPNKNIAYGGVYWQYFEDLDKIKTYEKTPITINKTITKQLMTEAGPKLIPVTDQTKLSIGDRVIIRIEIRVDRDMDYVHLQDMRSSGLEPTQVLSGYKWQDGLGYYQSIKDATADFFIDYLPKGTFVFEYPLKVSHSGNFSNGITTIQSYYAPEFTSHSAGDRVVVE